MIDQTSAFYDEFLKKRMVGYRIDGNLRIEAAARLLESLVKNSSVVADIGCGIGIIAERLGRRYPNTTIVGVDISPSNIEYARRTISLPNVKFIDANPAEQFDRLLDASPNGFDTIILMDVVEHIPTDQRPILFANLSRLATPEAFLVLTYPSPEYQRHLIHNNPSELQIIDNVIELQDLLFETAPLGWKLRYFNYIDVWHYNQYIHAVFARSLESDPKSPEVPTLFRRIASRIDRAVFRPRRFRTYAVNPFLDK